MNLISALRVFVRVVERGSMTAAAHDLGISQPAVSKIVRELEAHVGTRLLARSSRALGPTAHGLALCQAIGTPLAAIDAAIEAIRNDVGGVTGALHVHAPVCLGERHLSQIVLDFQVAHPSVKVQLTLEDRAVDLVKANVDLAIHVGVPDGESLVTRRIGTSRRFLAAAPNYLAGRGTPRRLVDLDGHDLIATQTILSRRGTICLCRGKTIREIPARPALTTNNPQVQLAALRAGHGIGAAQLLLVSDELKSGRLVRVLPRYEVKGNELYLTYTSTRLLRPVVRAFIDRVVPALRRVDGIW